MKICTKCGIEKDESEFTANRNTCKLCKRTDYKQYYEENKEKIKKRKNNGIPKIKILLEKNRQRDRKRKEKTTHSLNLKMV